LRHLTDAKARRGCADAKGMVTFYVLQAHSLLICERATATKNIRYRGRKLIARQYANGWQIEIVPLQHGAGHTQTRTFRELVDAINKAKKIVDQTAKLQAEPQPVSGLTTWNEKQAAGPGRPCFGAGRTAPDRSQWSGGRKEKIAPGRFAGGYRITGSGTSADTDDARPVNVPRMLQPSHWIRLCTPFWLGTRINSLQQASALTAAPVPPPRVDLDRNESGGERRQLFQSA
jgi:hypothetical protein